MKEAHNIRLLVLLILAACLSVGQDCYGQCSGLDFSASSTKGCIPLVVHFKATGYPSGSSFKWNLQSGFVSGSDTITWAYSTAGIFKISMIVTPASGSPCPAVVKDTFITVLPIPIPKMHSSTGFTVCNGSLPVLFGDSTLNTSTRQWIIEGNSLTSKNLAYTFAGRGNIPVNLIVTDQFGCQGTSKNNFNVNDSVKVDFCANINVNNPTNVVAQFTAQTGPYVNRTITGYSWLFPGGLPSSGNTATMKVAYPDYSKKHDVSLVVTMSDGCSYTILRRGFVSPFLSPAFATMCANYTFYVSGDISDTGRHLYTFSFPDASLFMTPPGVPDPKGGYLRYDIPGNYTASISYRYKGLGCAITINYPKFVRVHGAKAGFNSHDNQLCKLTDTAHFINTTDTTDAPGLKYTWYVYDSNGITKPAKLLKKLGTSAGRDTSFSPSTLPPNSGISFGIGLVVSSSNGCKDSLISPTLVNVAIPKADFIVHDIQCLDKEPGVKITAKPTPAGNTLHYIYKWFIRSDTDPNDTFVPTGQIAVVNADRLGLYDVYLNVFNGHCSGDTFKKAIFNLIGDSTYFTASPRAGCMNPDFTSTVSVGKESLNPDDPNNPPIYYWSVNTYDKVYVKFKDPFAKSTEVTITQSGCYDIFLDIFTIVGNDTCKQEIFYSSYICAGSGIGYRVQDRTCPGDTIKVDNYSGSKAYGFKWSVAPKDLADILPNDTARKISIVFKKDTCYTVQLIGSKVILGHVCTDTIIADNVCLPAYRTDFFTTTPSLYCGPTIARFYDPIHNGDSSQYPIKYLWDFGDGDTLATKNDSVAHVYTSLLKGDYNVKLTVSYNDGCHYSLTKKIIDVVGPVPHFTMDTKTGCDSELVQFKNTSKNVSSFYFFYGDGTPLLTTNPGPHTYVLQDPRIDSVTYYPTLIETDDTVCKMYFKDSIKLYRVPVDAKIKTDTTIGCVPFTLQFHALSKSANSWRWDFDGDGIIDDSTHKDPVFTYKKPGKYKASVSFSFHGKCPYIVQSKEINVTPISGARFTQSTFDFCGKQIVSFKNTSTEALKYIFDYGDGSAPDTNVIVKHLYSYNPINNPSDSIQYFPKIIAINGAGCTDTFQSLITGYKPPVSAFKSSVVYGCSPLKAHFTDTGSNSFVSEWDFDNDGKIDAYGKEADWVYTPGLYTVKLRSYSVRGCVDSLVKVNMIEVSEPPKANFSVSDSMVCYRQKVQFINLTQAVNNIVSWQWIFGDSIAPSQTSDEKNPSFKYYSPGWHTVTLTAIDDKGCSSSIIKKSVFVDDTVPPPNTQLLYVTVKDTNSITIAWRKSTYPLFKTYRLSRLENGKPVKVYATSNKNDTVFTENNSKINASGLSYCYNIQTQNICDSVSFFSNSHCTILLNETALPGPGNLLKWSAYIGWQPASYRIFRTGQNGILNLIATVGGKTLAYLDSSLCDETYCYYIEAVSDNGGYISKSNTTCLHSDYVKITDPLNLRYVTVWNDKQTKLEWDATTNKNLVSYLIDRYTTATGWINKYAATAGNFYIDNNVDVNDYRYIYRIRTIDGCGYTNPVSNEGTSVLLNQRINDDNVALSWNKYKTWQNGLKYYRLQVQLKDKSFKTIATLTDTVYKDDSVYHTIDTAYCYRVIAYQNGQDSSISNRTCAVLPSRIFVPNAFTPGNGDSLNDVWKVSAISIYNAVGKNIKSFSTKIFNRWGTLVFESNDLNKGWNGTFKGNQVPQDVYIYLIDAEGIDGSHLHLKGNLTVVN